MCGDGRAAVNILDAECTIDGRVRGRAAVLNILAAAQIDRRADGGAALIIFGAASVDRCARDRASLDKYQAAKVECHVGGGAKDIFIAAVIRRTDDRAAGGNL